MNSMWLNLPVKDIETTQQFFDTIGFQTNRSVTQNPDMLKVSLSTGMIIIFIQETRYYQMMPALSNITANNALISMDTDTHQKVDDLAHAWQQAGGTVLNAPSQQGTFYGASFQDINGYYYNIIVM